jgi:hypothetical protein
MNRKIWVTPIDLSPLILLAARSEKNDYLIIITQKNQCAMSRKIWATLIDLSLPRSASCLFREEEVTIISSSWKRKKRVIV